MNSIIVHAGMRRNVAIKYGLRPDSLYKKAIFIFLCCGCHCCGACIASRRKLYACRRPLAAL